MTGAHVGVIIHVYETLAQFTSVYPYMHTNSCNIKQVTLSNASVLVIHISLVIECNRDSYK